MRRTGRFAAISPVAGDGVDSTSVSFSSVVASASVSVVASGALSSASSAGSSGKAAASSVVGAGGGSRGSAAFSSFDDEAGVPWSASAWLGGMLGGMATGAVEASGVTTGSMTSVRASEEGTSGGGGACGGAPASSIIPMRASTPDAEGSAEELGTKRMFVSPTGEPSCESLRFLMPPILYSRSTKVGLG